jgi:hypothetical protein
MEVGSEIVAGATISVLKNIDIGAIRVVADRIAIGGRDNFGLAPASTRSVSRRQVLVQPSSESS